MDPVFTFMTEVIKVNWKQESNRRGIFNTGSELIMYYIMLFVLLLSIILNYLEVVLEVLRHYFSTIKIEKHIFKGQTRIF